MKMRTELELLRLLRERVEAYLDSDLIVGICMVVHFMDNMRDINPVECSCLNGILYQNWHLSKYPDDVFKFDTMQERMDFLDILIKKYENEN